MSENNAGTLGTEIKDAVQRAQDGFNASKGAFTETLEEGKTSANRLVNSGLGVAEGYLDDATYQVRRNPRAAVAMAFGAGALAGALFGLLAPRAVRSTGDSPRRRVGKHSRVMPRWSKQVIVTARRSLISMGGNYENAKGLRGHPRIRHSWSLGRMLNVFVVELA